MPLTEEQLKAKYKNRNIGDDILSALTELKAGKSAKITEVPICRQAREITKMTQEQFALAINVSVKTIREWEQGRRKPSGAAVTLLKVAIVSPSAIKKAMKAA